MLKNNLLVFSFLSVFGVSVGQFLQTGQCDPNIPVVENFNAEQFLGSWYEIARADNSYQVGECSTIQFQNITNIVNVRSSEVIDNFVQDLNGTATVVNGTARLSLTFSPVFNESLDYWVLLTDYTNFALTYACENVGPTQRRVYVWQLGRQTRYPNEMIPALMNTTIANLLGINAATLRSISHDETICYVLPNLEYGEPVILTGQCNSNIPVVQNFDVARFLGVWHEIASYHSENALGNCSRAQYTLGDGVVNVVNSQVVSQSLETMSGFARVSSNDGSARLTVVLNVAPGVTAQQELWVLATDYTGYALSYTCTNLPNNQKRVFSWILSRERSLSINSTTAVNQVINSNIELNNRYYQAANNTDADCFYYPEPNNEPVIFRGQCDPNVPVVQNFNAARYLGLWHDIESYPTPFQGGSCSNAFYSLSGGSVNVFNTQVVNRSLDTINAVASANVDGSGKLVVTFPVAGTNSTFTTEYWILATDYDNYALVYTCTNLPNDQRQIASWKLSRTKQLTAAASTAINSVVNTINILDQRYYLTIDQTPNGCFYFPEPQLGVPVVFPGQCHHTNVPSIQNFNFAQFAGLWHEIEAYPKDDQPGQCINHQFSLIGTNTFSLTSTNVYDQFQGTTNSTVALTNNDSTGNLTITITVNGTAITIPYAIISTDYNSYALAYSCVNLNNDFRGIYSWKLSRTKQLTAAANSVINIVLASIDVLDNDYFEDINQSDQACFFLPELAPGAPIVLVGQCDPNIAVMQNFNAARYLGRWRLIEGYPSDSQLGTCEEANYSLAANGSVVVFNTEVVNQSLATITGTAVLATTDGSGKLNVTFPNIPGVFEYWILDTDYDSYALVYGCANISTTQRRVWSWKMSRTNSLTQNATNAINQVLNRVEVLNNRYYQTINRTDAGCFYYPEPTNEPVIFRGQCDQNIPVVQNFNAVAYMGLWHDVESYPAPFQDGTCNNAFYTLNGGVVDVFNTQVINQTLDTINGIAILATTDGTAKLYVTFPVAGTNLTTQTNYWVLATDYTSYSLVYSCRNLNDEQSQVTTWKLSRTKQLTAAAVTAINNVFNTVNVLDQRYVQAVDQSRNGCFYFPVPRNDQPVIFPGQCSDTNVPVVQNFNLALFQGLWHEIQAYPEEQQQGQCINHQFTVSGNTFSLTSSNVLDQFMGITNSTVTLATTDNSANMTITITANGTVLTIPYVIVSTDYSSYALAYSCVNLNNDYRGVWSWKLSRTKQLTAAANTAINTVMSPVNVLDNMYFANVNQSDEACFYLPDLAPGAPVVLVGQCDPNIPVVQNFNAARYLGRWRLIEGYPSDSQLGTCEEANYSLGANGTVVVFNTEVVNQALATITGTAIVASTDGSAKLNVTFPNIPGVFEYWVLDTDYDSYALVYGCQNINAEQRRVWSWKMSRTNTLTQNATNSINQIVNSVNVLNNRFYQAINRTDAGCFYYPEPSNEPVVFRGQCNQNIPVVQNFNAVAYMGLWHDIESYPTPFQEGTCSNALYTLSGSVVNVFNTQVINRTLDTINGLAILATTDGSAKLNVSFPVAGTNLTTQTDYWVLATDYSSYSLVYSCRNLNDEQRQVTSWKLSRTKQLTTAASTAINTVVNTVDVLDQRYHQTVDQSANGCFYFPEPQAGLPVVFPGQCDLNIPAVQNFNMQMFQGIWHEIQAYPKDEQPGQCINHQFTAGTANVHSLQSSNVLNQTLNVNNGTITFSSTDNSARLTITIQVNGTSVAIPYVIVATDYSNYALAYSCVNINSDQKGVWSWKLSRTKELTAASSTAINMAMANIEVLDSRYYETINQTDAACFYLPALSPGEPVVFVGQCDANIPVVQNFNAARYLGLWRLIETYPSEFQLGTCNDATYSLGANGSVVVFNTEVVNQTLSTMTGSAVLATTDGSGKLTVTFPNSQPLEYWILDTDYETYTLIYSCANITNERRRVWSWKMSRTNTLTQNAVTAINQVVDRVNVLDSRYFQAVSRSDAACFYYPTPDSNSPVVFRGQCDETIPVVQNFNAGLYLGLWHDIERYPAPFQNGTCGNAFYSLLGGVVDVFNTQVINRTLDTMRGVAVVVSQDASAKLNVTFPVGGVNVTTSYWVLATDYSSYAFVYSCRNLDTEYRQVSSWKLSRTKSLPATAATVINTIVNTIPVLDQRYYETQDQSPEGCFYFPEPQEGVPVVFPGQCDPNITAVPNFSMQQFQGIWHEIQAYPKDDQPGQCINHQFTSGATNTLNLQSSNVLNQILNVNNGTVTFSSSDSSARLTITITVNGTAVTIPYVIVATDYNNYALAYSCVNIGNDNKGVWSWKLSRSKQLTAASNTAINTAMSTIDVLDNRYNENINQTDAACFFLPVLSPGEPVVFVGQCDPNIPVVQNFNAARYLGLWRLIETYPSQFQLGSCNEATYSLGANGSVIVFNTEVINQTLSTITGSAVLASTDGSGKLTVNFPGFPPLEYWILDTDYETYTLVYSCANITSEQRRVWSWKMSRTNTLTANATNAINQVLDRVNVLDNRYFETVNRTDASCFYYPEPTNSPVVFRGQCDQNISVVQNFNAVRYMGLWHDIESYPAPFQNGTCANARYTLNADGTVSVFNTQVVNQVLDTMSGTAVLASTDGSARLRVTFPVGGVNVTTDYWVLATDYDSYAFVYTCENISSEQRRVFSWKLSRQQNLTAAAATAINTVVSNVDVLSQQYFIDRVQTTEGCFYYPDNFGGPVILNGQCVADNDVPAITNFNINAFSGTWYEESRFPSEMQVGECAASQYVINSQTSYNITQTIVRDESLISTFIPLATVGNATNRGVISASVTGAPITSVFILATDYLEYALAYGCRNFANNTKQIYSWKLSRSRAGLSTTANNAIDFAVSNNVDLFEGYYERTDQSNAACFYYPVFDQTPNTIILPGPCNDTIRAVPNFNAASYLGRWFEVSRYPQPTQFGQCDRAQYSLGNNVVDVTNTHVYNQTLLSMIGTAVVASNDTSGLLNVTFVVDGVVRVINYYVLATDYTSYALVYNCRNLENGDRQVGSWKLSRTTSLSAQANNVIDSVINSTQGLLERFYLTTNQTDEACFYIPEVDVNRAPRFRGQCENIMGMQNFDVQRYLGWWHEIERYPSDNNVGECISSQYQASGTQFRVVDTSVANGTATVVTGTVTATSDGRLRRTLSNGQIEEILVLATDYETYALLYSCVNVDSEYRRVWSAKHSKARQLTQAAQNAMAPLINSSQVLYPQFYLTVNQSDQACFHYPVQTGQEVILPGQCDLSIPVQQNFDVAAYAGTWYQMERYPYPQIRNEGTCVGARYVLDAASGVISVLNWEVIDGVLGTVNGTAVVTSTDGSARLSVTLPVIGTNATVTSSLFVLATDYETYSLAYSCVNINSFQRSVGAWKLSRTRTMPAAGTTAINAVMAQRQELHQPFFIQIHQNDTCEEPSSAILVKSSIIVMLVCVLLQMLL